MEEFGEHNAGSSQIWELSNGQDQQWCSPDSFEGMPYQQDCNFSHQQDYYSPYQPDFHSQIQPPFYSQPQPDSNPTLHSLSFQDLYNHHLTENAPNFFHPPEFVPNFQTPSNEPFPHFQSQQQFFYPHSYTNLEFQQGGQPYFELQPPLFSEEQLAILLEALKPDLEWFIKREQEEKEFSSVLQGAGFPWRSSESEMQNGREEKEEKACHLVDKALEWGLGVEESEFGTKEEEFRGVKAPELLQNVEEKSMVADHHLYPKFRKGEEVVPYFPCEGGLFLQSFQQQLEEGKGVQKEEHKGEEEEKKVEEIDYNLYPKFRKGGRVIPYDQYREEEEEKMIEIDYSSYPMLRIGDRVIAYDQFAEEESEKKELEAVHCTLLERVEEAPLKELTCKALDILVQGEQNLLQHGSSIQGKGEEEENLQISPPSLQLLRIKGNSVEDFTRAELDFPLRDESSINDGQRPTKGEKQEGGRRITPDLLKYEASELHLPQATTPRHKEAAAVYPLMSNSFSPVFELTINEFLLSLKMFISGDKLKIQQLSFHPICKLQSIAEFGEVHKKGARGDGVPWFIKVHPP